MTADLKQYIDSLQIQVYRMIDGSTLLSEENHRDTVDDYVILYRPLQICSVFVEGSIKTLFIPWMPGTGEQVRVNMSSIIAESDADFDQKMAYSRYYLLSHLQKYLPSEEYESIVNDATIKPSKKKPSMPKLSTQLKQQLAKQKRFNLN